MNTDTFYAITAATCFTLVGLWWSVVKDKPEWLKDEAKKRLAGGVYASFLIPGRSGTASDGGAFALHPDPDRPCLHVGVHDQFIISFRR